VFSPRRLAPSPARPLEPAARVQEAPTSTPADPNVEQRGEGSRAHKLPGTEAS